MSLETRSSRAVKLPRLMTFRVMIEKYNSTLFTHPGAPAGKGPRDGDAQPTNLSSPSTRGHCRDRGPSEQSARMPRSVDVGEEVDEVTESFRAMSVATTSLAFTSNAANGDAVP